MLALSFFLIGVNGFCLFFLGRYARQIQADLIHLAIHVRQLTADGSPGEYK